MKKYCQIICYILFFSCSTKNESNENNINIITSDSTIRIVASEFGSEAYDLWLNTKGLVSEEQVPHFEILNNVEINLESNLTNLKDSLFNSLDLRPTKSLKNLEDSSILILNKSLLDGNIQDFIASSASLMKLNSGKYEQKLLAYNFCFAEEYGFARGYYDVYIYYYRKNAYIFSQFIRKNSVDKKDPDYLKYLSKEEKYLAIYSLIKSYKKGNLASSILLSDYIRKGLYFSQNSEIADKLETIYDNM